MDSADHQDHPRNVRFVMGVRDHEIVAGHCEQVGYPHIVFMVITS